MIIFDIKRVSKIIMLLQTELDEIVNDNDRVRQLDIAERPNEADKDDSLPAVENIYVPLTLSMVICLIQVFVI